METCQGREIYESVNSTNFIHCTSVNVGFMLIRTVIVKTPKSS